jgi:hypothetical protein
LLLLLFGLSYVSLFELEPFSAQHLTRCALNGGAVAAVRNWWWIPFFTKKQGNQILFSYVLS